jgi:hypothetical protein
MDFMLQEAYHGVDMPEIGNLIGFTLNPYQGFSQEF